MYSTRTSLQKAKVSSCRYALTAHEATGLGAWAAGSAGHMPKLAAIIPSYIECVTILAHDDEAGQRGAHSLAEALYQRRIEVIVEGLS